MRKRRITLEPWMAEVVAVAICKGMPFSAIYGLLGVSAAKFRSWYVAGTEESQTDPMLIDFALAVDEARSKAVQDGVRLMNTHAAGDWRAAHALLQVSDPETWVVSARVKVDSHVTVERDLSRLGAGELEALALLEDKIYKEEA